MKSILRTTLVLFVLLGSGFILIKYWSFIFAREVQGRIYNIDKLNTPLAIMGGGGMAPTRNALELQNQAMFSYAIAIREANGEIVTASSEDRQWAVAQVNQCVEAKYYVYPPWDLQSAGTYFNARLIRLFDCPPDMPAAPSHPAPVQPSATPAPSTNN
jgi:hypothetical protein